VRGVAVVPKSRIKTAFFPSEEAQQQLKPVVLNRFLSRAPLQPLFTDKIPPLEI